MISVAPTGHSNNVSRSIKSIEYFKISHFMSVGTLTHI